MTTFVRPTAAGHMEWWARCDSCRWSGPAEKFHLLTRDQGREAAHVCNHQWCWNERAILEYRTLGWKCAGKGL